MSRAGGDLAARRERRADGTCEALEGRCRVLDTHVAQLECAVERTGRSRLDPLVAERIDWVVADRDRLMEIIREGGG